MTGANGRKGKYLRKSQVPDAGVCGPGDLYWVVAKPAVTCCVSQYLERTAPKNLLPLLCPSEVHVVLLPLLFLQLTASDSPTLHPPIQPCVHPSLPCLGPLISARFQAPSFRHCKHTAPLPSSPAQFSLQNVFLANLQGWINLIVHAPLLAPARSGCRGPSKVGRLGAPAASPLRSH